MIGRIIRQALQPVFSLTFPRKWKEYNEFKYWRKRKAEEGKLTHEHYADFYMAHFGLERDFYAGKRILDIGCGPRGSLEWADMALERVGLDPLADKYLSLGVHAHTMNYMTAYSEAIPFEDEHFDVVCSFNSLDHVEDLDATILEIKRITKPGALFLLLTDVNHEATPYEPQTFSWDIVDAFTPDFEVVEEKHYEKKAGGMYQSIQQGLRYDHTDYSSRYGILSVKFFKAEA